MECYRLHCKDRGSVSGLAANRESDAGDENGSISMTKREFVWLAEAGHGHKRPHWLFARLL